MQGTSAKGVLSQLSLLEAQARSRKAHPHLQFHHNHQQQQQQSRVKELKVKVERLKLQRDQLRAEIQAHQNVQKLRMSLDKPCAREEDEAMDDDSDESQLLRLMARHTQLRDLLQAHHLAGGYDIIKTCQGKGVCVSLSTSHEGTYLETYNLEIDLKPTVGIRRHNIPPFIPLNSIAEKSSMQTDMRGFLDVLSQHLNAFAGRKQQLKLVKELKSVEVLESNVLCSLLVLMVTVPNENTAVLCKLSYADHTRYLPSQVSFECEDEKLPDSPQWKENCSLLMKTPVHKALKTMKEMGSIA